MADRYKYTVSLNTQEPREVDTLQEVADELGITHRTTYLHFKDFGKYNKNGNKATRVVVTKGEGSSDE